MPLNNAKNSEIEVHQCGNMHTCLQLWNVEYNDCQLQHTGTDNMTCIPAF